tara:strand:- start:8483 stop:9397 length:915 start_codon:yes stop_codon:yes gene_type:complete
MKLNGVQVVERFTRPGTLNRVLLRASFLNNGDYIDPVVSSVTLFLKGQHLSPSSVLEASSQLISDTAASTAKFRWSGPFKEEVEYTTSPIDASSVYRTGTGQYAVVLDGMQSPPVSTSARDGTIIENTASGTGEYIDVWTVSLDGGTSYQVFINNVELFKDNIVSLTEPLLIKTKTRLVPNIIRLGSKVDLKVGMEVTIMNKNLDQNVKNILSHTVIENPQFVIKKQNEDSNLPSRVVVKSYIETADDIRLTSDNTMIFSLDTAVLTNGSIVDLGSGSGAYTLEAKYTVMGETIISPLMYFTVR